MLFTDCLNFFILQHFILGRLVKFSFSFSKLTFLKFKSGLSSLEAFAIVGFSLLNFCHIDIDASSVLWLGCKSKFFSAVQFFHVSFEVLFVMVSFKSVRYLHIGYFSHNNNFLEQVLNQIFLCVCVGIYFVRGCNNERSCLLLQFVSQLPLLLILDQQVRFTRRLAPLYKTDITYLLYLAQQILVLNVDPMVLISQCLKQLSLLIILSDIISTKMTHILNQVW
jgi:hypothetical protein